jgi:hypothetical protein
VEDGRGHPVVLDREPKRRARPDDVALPDQVVEAPRAEALGERGLRLAALVRGLAEEVFHPASMLRETVVAGSVLEGAGRGA